MSADNKPGREELSKSEKKYAARDGIRDGVKLGSSSIALTSALFGDKATMVVSGITTLAANAPEIRDVGKAVVDVVRRKVGRDKT